jgi:antitoxin CcdA
MALQKSISRKKPVNLTLAPDLVSEARTYTPNLSETIEDLLEGFVLKERSARASRQSEINRCLSAWNSYNENNVTFADEFGRI